MKLAVKVEIKIKVSCTHETLIFSKEIGILTWDGKIKKRSLLFKKNHLIDECVAIKG